MGLLATQGTPHRSRKAHFVGSPCEAGGGEPRRGTPIHMTLACAAEVWEAGQLLSVSGLYGHLSGCTYEAQVNLLWTPHNLASVGALRAQIPAVTKVQGGAGKHGPT